MRITLFDVKTQKTIAELRGILPGSIHNGDLLLLNSASHPYRVVGRAINAEDGKQELCVFVEKPKRKGFLEALFG
jgi:hypothetical protein